MQKISQTILKPREEEILQLLSKFRFLTSTQIQILLQHKSKDKPIKWLNNLTEKNYIYRFYTSNFYNVPALFCLDKVSIPYLREKGTNESLLKRIYKEKKLTQQFRNHCIFIAQVYISLFGLTQTTKATLKYYSKTDLFSFDNLLSPIPDAYFVITEKDGIKRRYFLDLFPFSKPWRTYKLRIQGYIKYYKSNLWQQQAEKDFPEVILICPNEAVFRWLVKKIKNLGFSNPRFYLALRSDIQKNGINKQLLKKIEV